MADIKQAAKWMREGKTVRRPHFFGDFAYLAHKMRGLKINQITTTDSDIADEPFSLEDRLADDWEIVEDRG